MIPWLISISILLLVIVGLIIERAVSGHLSRKELARLRASQEEGFAKLGDVQKGLFTALRNAYEGQERAYKFVAEQIEATDKKLGIERKPVKPSEPELWADVVGDKEE